MDTLPLNGNFNNSYSLREGDYEDPALRCPAECALGLDDATFEKMIISELVHNNLRPRGVPRNQSDTKCEQGFNRREPAAQQTRVSIDGGVGNSSGSEDDAIVADADTSALPPSTNHPALELLLLNPNHRVEALEAPLLPQRTHSLLYCAQRASQRATRPQEDSGETKKEVRPTEEENTSSPNNRDLLYTSMPNLRDSSPSPAESIDPANREDDDSPCSSARSEPEELCHKSLPDLGDGTQPLSYYQISRRGTSESCIGPVLPDGCLPHEGEADRDGQMQLITSL